MADTKPLELLPPITFRMVADEPEDEKFFEVLHPYGYIVLGNRRVFFPGSYKLFGELNGLFWDIFSRTPTAETPASEALNRFAVGMGGLFDERRYLLVPENLTPSFLEVYIAVVESGVDGRDRYACFESENPVAQLRRLLESP